MMQFRKIVCTTFWAAGAALTLAAGAAGQACPAQGSCFEVHGTPGCSYIFCCQEVCAFDSYCCNVSWDSLCVDEALEFCGNCGDPASPSCYQFHDDPGCNDEACCAAVCAIDGFCCAQWWDFYCSGTATEICAGCGAPDAGSCFDIHGPGCDDVDCCFVVCNADPYCCETSWDGICADEALAMCSGCGDPESGSCFAAHEGHGCNDADCCFTVCTLDLVCCSQQWDGLCAVFAGELCGDCGNPAAGNCYSANGVPGCDLPSCCMTVCALDETCCLLGWDFECVYHAIVECSLCGSESAGDCFDDDNTPGCNIESCCESVCLIDTYCCATAWDWICVNEARDLCCDSACPGDLDGDADVDGADLGLLLAEMGSEGRCADLDGSGLVDGADLGLLLSAYGQCVE